MASGNHNVGRTETSPESAGSDEDWFAIKVPSRGSLTPRGERTRQRLMASARALLEEQGYHGSTVTKITERSGVALGNFYRYFDNKEELYLLLLQSLVQELYSVVGGVWNADDVRGSLKEATLRYLRLYRENRRLIAALQEVAGVVPEAAELWWELRLRTYWKMERYIQRVGVPSDLADLPNAAGLMASALGGMVEQFASYWYVQNERQGRPAPTLEEAAEALSALWFRSVYQANPPNSRRTLDNDIE